MSFLFGAGASLLSAASQQLVNYLEWEVQQAELEEQQQQQEPRYEHSNRRPATHLSPQRRVSLPSHRLLSSPSPPTPPHSTTLLSSPTHSLLSTSALFAHSGHSSTTHPTCTCTTAHTTAGDYTLSPFTVEFATALSDHPTTFHRFPACCEWSDRFHLSAVQLVHARRLLSECAVFGRLRREVRETGEVSEFEFWRVYFLLLHNVKARERRQRTTRRRSQGARRRSSRKEGDQRDDKENVIPTTSTKAEKPLNEREAEKEADTHDVEEDEEEQQEDERDWAGDVVEEDELERHEQERVIWAEVDRITLRLSSIHQQAPAASAITTPSKAAVPFVALFHCSPGSVNDSASSDYYASPSPQQPCGQLFHRLTADEQQSVADMTTQQQRLLGVDDDEHREVSRLVFSPTPSLDSSLSGDEWDACSENGQDSAAELDLSADISDCSFTGLHDPLSHTVIPAR